MPKAAPKPCAQVGCGVLVRDGSSRCEKHKVKAGTFADSRRGSRHARGYGTAWDKLRARVLSRDAGLCQPCLALGHTTPATQVDHITNKAQGGTDAEHNLQAICTPCHKAKTAQEAQQSRDTHHRSEAGKTSGPGASISGAPRTEGQQTGGGEKSAAPVLGTERLVKLFTPAKTTPPGLQGGRGK